MQDALITVLSEKTLPVPELGHEVQALRGFNVIATANDRDKGVNELSSALRRRFNTVVLPLPASEDDEVGIVASRVEPIGRGRWSCPRCPPAVEEIRRVVTVFRELRSGVTEDGRTKVKSPSGTLSTAEAISVVTNGLALSAHFGDGGCGRPTSRPASSARWCKDPVADRVVWSEYLEAVARERDGLVGVLHAPAATAGVSAAALATASRSSASATTGPGSARSLLRALEDVRARRGADRGPGGRGPAAALAGSPGHGAAGRAARLRRRRARAAAAFWPYRGVLARVAGDRAGRCGRGVHVALLRPARPANQPCRRRRDDEMTSRWTRSRSPRRRWPTRSAALAEAAGLRRPGALVGRRRRVPAGRRVAVPGASPRRWPRCARPTTRPRDPTEARREAYMRQMLRAALKGGHERVAVVCGAWHAPALAGRCPPRPPTRAILTGLPKAQGALTWVPWTHARLASATGYGAGITSPGWYHHLWTAPDQPVDPLADRGRRTPCGRGTCRCPART